MPTTLADIARALGVSKMTVSRAINNHPEISLETRARILDAAQRMNYRPNQFARALTTNRSFLLGVVVPDLMHSFFAEVANGLTKRVGPIGYHVVVANSDEDSETERFQLELLLARRVDGLVLASAQRDWKRGVPHVLRDSKTPCSRCASSPRAYRTSCALP